VGVKNYSRALGRALSKLGLYSRSEAFELVRSGRVKVNGRTVTDPLKSLSSDDRITINDKSASKEKGRYILFNKPAGCVTTSRDERSRRTVYDVLGDVGGRVFAVGRLDKETEGLLIFTNDTAFGDFLTDPANKIPRTYIVTADRVLAEKEIAAMNAGIYIGRGEFSRPVSVKMVKNRDAPGTMLEIVLTEGKNREIRRLCEAMGAKVKRLVRVSFGPFQLENLPSGGWRELSGRFCVDLYRFQSKIKSQRRAL
jgi:23S rRNA pseudouridine2605 synthase